MKKFLLSLFAAVNMMAVGYAQTWVAPAAGSDNVSPETVLVNNDFVTVSTVYSAKVTNYSATIGDYSFSSAVQLRIDAAPTSENKVGPEKEDCTPFVITAKKDVNFIVYYRRQSNSGAYVAGDGKDIKMCDQNGLAGVDGTMTLHSEATDYSPAEQTFELKKDHTYTLYARGTTAQIFGFDAVTPGPQAEKTEFIYANETAALNAEGNSQISYSDGARLVMLSTNKEHKDWSSGNSITVGGKTYKSTKVSNGKQNIFLAPAGKLIDNVTIYSYVNANDGDSFWKEVNNTTYTAADGLMASFKNGANPDVNTYDLGGVRSFTFNHSGKQLCFVLKVNYVASADMPETETFNLSLKAVENGAAYGTVALPFNVVKPAAVTAFTVELDGDKLALTEFAGNVLPAGVGFILKAEASEAVSFDAAKSEASVAAPVANDLVAIGEMPIKAPANSYVLAKKNNEVKFYKADTETLVIPAYKAYLVAESATAAAFRIVDETTAISSIESEKSLARQLFDIQGRQLQNAQGLHIQGGKLQFVK